MSKSEIVPNRLMEVILKECASASNLWFLSEDRYLSSLFHNWLTRRSCFLSGIYLFGPNASLL